MRSRRWQLQCRSSGGPIPSAWVSFPGPNGLAAGLRLHEAAELILSGQESAEVALQDAAFEINDLIAGETCSG